MLSLGKQGLDEPIACGSSKDDLRLYHAPPDVADGEAR